MVGRGAWRDGGSAGLVGRGMWCGGLCRGSVAVEFRLQLSALSHEFVDLRLQFPALHHELVGPQPRSLERQGPVRERRHAPREGVFGSTPHLLRTHPRRVDTQLTQLRPHRVGHLRDAASLCTRRGVPSLGTSRRPALADANCLPGSSRFARRPLRLLRNTLGSNAFQLPGSRLRHRLTRHCPTAVRAVPCPGAVVATVRVLFAWRSLCVARVSRLARFGRLRFARLGWFGHHALFATGPHLFLSHRTGFGCTGLRLRTRHDVLSGFGLAGTARGTGIGLTRSGFG
ncbi:hypothetical protein [Nocardia brasiliensis]|uniref:hypothetical protein n=1 Tax=Nocardia brasiliensis TaxID=37326 RepID=UPI001893FEF6|nr:hypothetical protein [Nocardia brasiliensis]MBF6546260.1 hypothetical protein [Nocardia brasiliensis]